MKKRYIYLVLLLSLLLFTGCSKKSSVSTSKKKVSAKNFYEIVSLKDTVNGVDAFQGIVPKGWKASIASNWNVVNSTHPGYETVTITNPEGTTRIIIISQQSYVYNPKFNEGENYDYYTTYKGYMNASTYLDYFINSYYNGATYVKDVEFSSDALNQLKELNRINVEQGKVTAQTLSGQNNISIDVNEYEVSASTKEYEYGLNYLEGSTAVSAIKTSLTSYLSPLLSSESISWAMPYTIVYQAETKEDFDKYYDNYKFIIANSNFTLEYYQMVEYVSSKIVNAYTSYYAARSKAALDATNDYIDSHYSSTSSQSTNDRVMEMWDDVIKEQDAYVLDDGSILKTSMFNETVAQNGNEIYIGSKAGIPEGFTQLDKDH